MSFLHACGSSVFLAGFHACLLAETFRGCLGQHTLSSQPTNQPANQPATKTFTRAIPSPPPPSPAIPSLPICPWFFECTAVVLLHHILPTRARAPSFVLCSPPCANHRRSRLAIVSGGRGNKPGRRRPNKNVLQQGGPPVPLRRAGRVQERPRAPAAGAGRAPLGRAVTTTEKKRGGCFVGWWWRPALVLTFFVSLPDGWMLLMRRER